MQYLISQNKKKYCKFSPIFIFYFFIEKKTKTTSNMEKTSYAEARSNLCTLNDAITEKQSLDLIFLSPPNIPAKFSQENTRGQT
jgi:hypothetical protein